MVARLEWLKAAALEADMVVRLETLKAAALEADVAALEAAMLADRAEAQRTATQRTADGAWKAYLAACVDAARAEQEAN